jgi:hypothetical protein
VLTPFVMQQRGDVLRVRGLRLSYRVLIFLRTTSQKDASLVRREARGCKIHTTTSILPPRCWHRDEKPHGVELKWMEQSSSMQGAPVCWGLLTDTWESVCGRQRIGSQSSGGGTGGFSLTSQFRRETATVNHWTTHKTDLGN